ncbi:MAG: sodium:proton antiporter NhaD [Bacteroidales bacterium]
MICAIIVVFVLGYIAIALEHPLKVDKTASSLLLGMVLWTMYAIGVLDGNIFHGIDMNIVNGSIIEHMGDISEILFFLVGAMTVVEFIDVNGGFYVITDRITTRKKRSLLWLLCFITFFMSAVLDNLTTSIVMVMVLRKLVSEQKDRWLFGSMIVIAANSGGAWSPIGDVTTIMLWVSGNVTTAGLTSYLLVPSLVSMIVPLLILARGVDGSMSPQKQHSVISGGGCSAPGGRMNILILGVLSLVLVPVFKALTGVMLFLSILWIYTEVFYRRNETPKEQQHRIPDVLHRIDIPTILFFLGILMAVAVLQVTGILGSVASYLDSELNNPYIISLILGILSSVVDNVPLVAAVMGMYPVADISATGYMANFVQDGTFWKFISYCAGVGGSMLIIGSAAGVVVMGLERINFVWYLKKISFAALLGYLAGAAVYIIEIMLFAA